MKKLLALILVSTLISSCAGNKISDLSSDSKTQNIADLPEWVVIPDTNISDGVAGVGIASPSVGGIKFQIPQAETDARANIAATISTEISRITKDALREAKVAQVNDVEQVFTQATKEVVKNFPLSGAKRTDIYQAKDGSLYIRMIVRREDYSRYLENSQKVYEGRLKQANLSRDNLNKAQDAVKDIFNELDVERKN